MWDDTVVVLTTDHGHILGERGYWGKMQMALYDELAHIPLIVCAPGGAGGGRVQRALTTTVDLMPTFLELHRMALPDQVQGRSLCHLLTADADHHETVLYGGFGKDVCLTDGRYRYFRQALPESWVHHHTMMPRGQPGLPGGEPAGVGVRLLPQVPERPRLPAAPLATAFEAALDAPDLHLLFDGEADPGQQNPLRDAALEERMAALLRDRLTAVEAPDCQYQRLGL